MGIVIQAGAIVVRYDGPQPRVLLVTARRNPQYWIFPKGHIDPGESPETAALREAREEAGVTADSLGPLGETSFQMGADVFHVQYFGAAARNEGCESEGRQLAWLTKDDALTRLTFEDLRTLLQEGWSSLLERRPTA